MASAQNRIAPRTNDTPRAQTRNVSDAVDRSNMPLLSKLMTGTARNMSLFRFGPFGRKRPASHRVGKSRNVDRVFQTVGSVPHSEAPERNPFNASEGGEAEAADSVLRKPQPAPRLASCGRTGMSETVGRRWGKKAHFRLQRTFSARPGLLPGGRVLHVFATFTALVVFPLKS